MSHDLHLNVEGGMQGQMDNAYAFNGGMPQQQQAQFQQPQQQQPTDPNVISLRNSAHPTVCIFHVIFKLIALALYITGSFFSGDGRGGTSGAKFITVTVICILFLAADFWVVKNVTGRLLVGLRWWNQVEGDTTRWIFESKGEEASNRTDSRVFWTVLYLTPVVWGCLFIVGLFRLTLGWLLVVCIALALSISNVYGYYRCSSDQKARFQQMITQQAQQGAIAAVRSNLFGMLIGTSTASPNNAAASTTTTQTFTTTQQSFV